MNGPRFLIQYFRRHDKSQVFEYKWLASVKQASISRVFCPNNPAAVTHKFSTVSSARSAYDLHSLGAFLSVILFFLLKII